MFEPAQNKAIPITPDNWMWSTSENKDAFACDLYLDMGIVACHLRIGDSLVIPFMFLK